MNNILVIDYSAKDFQHAQSILAYAGYKLTHCQDILQVNQLTVSSQPDVILIDMVYPNKSFFAIMLELKSSTITGRIPVIAVGAEDSAANRQIAETLGAYTFISKPYAFANLLSAVQKSINP